MGLAAAAPKYGWTDLAVLAGPDRAHSQEPGSLPATNGCDSGPLQPDGSPCPAPQNPIGIPKQSINLGALRQRQDRRPAGLARTRRSRRRSTRRSPVSSRPYPLENNPLCATTVSTLLPEFLRERSAYYQNDFFHHLANETRAIEVPVFGAATFTDPLFPPIEHRRMLNRLRAIDSDYPIQAYHGDYQHFVQNKAKEWGDICGADHHVCTLADYPERRSDVTDFNPTPAASCGPAPRRGSTASSTTTRSRAPTLPSRARLRRHGVAAGLPAERRRPRRRRPTSRARRFTAPTFEQLAPNTLDVDDAGSAEHDLRRRAQPARRRAPTRSPTRCRTRQLRGRDEPAGPGVAELPQRSAALGADDDRSDTVEIDFRSSARTRWRAGSS